MTDQTSVDELWKERKQEISTSIDDLLKSKDCTVCPEVLSIMQELLDSTKVKSSIQSFYEDTQN